MGGYVVIWVARPRSTLLDKWNRGAARPPPLTPVSSMRSFWGLMRAYWVSERWKQAWGLTLVIVAPHRTIQQGQRLAGRSFGRTRQFDRPLPRSREYDAADVAADQRSPAGPPRAPQGCGLHRRPAPLLHDTASQVARLAGQPLQRSPARPQSHAFSSAARRRAPAAPAAQPRPTISTSASRNRSRV